MKVLFDDKYYKSLTATYNKLNYKVSNKELATSLGIVSLYAQLYPIIFSLEETMTSEGNVSHISPEIF